MTKWRSVHQCGHDDGAPGDTLARSRGGVLLVSGTEKPGMVLLKIAALGPPHSPQVLDRSRGVQGGAWWSRLHLGGGGRGGAGENGVGKTPSARSSLTLREDPVGERVSPKRLYTGGEKQHHPRLPSSPRARGLKADVHVCMCAELGSSRAGGARRSASAGLLCGAACAEGRAQAHVSGSVGRACKARSGPGAGAGPRGRKSVAQAQGGAWQGGAGAPI